MEKFDIVISTKDNFENLEKSILSIDRIADYKKYKINIIVVDDKSSKSTRDSFLNKIIKYMAAHTNIEVSPMFIGKQVGYLKSLNLGINACLNKKYKSNYICILNDNYEVSENWFDEVITQFKEHPEAECISSSDEDIEENSFGKINLNGCAFKIDAVKFLDEKVISPLNASKYLAEKYDSKNIFISSNLKIKCNKKETDNEALAKTTDHFVEFKKSLNENKAYVVYTFVGNDEKEPNVTNFDSKFEYICFTTKNVKINPIWKVVNVSDIKNSLKFTDRQMKEFIKLNPHLFFETKTLSVWFDSSVITDFTEKDYTSFTYKMNPKNFMLCTESTTYDCSYKMLIDLINGRMMSLQNYDGILQLYKWFNLKPGIGMIDTSVMIRKHNDERCISTMNRVWNYVSKFNQKSELFMNLILFINKFNYSYIPNKLFFSRYCKLAENAK